MERRGVPHLVISDTPNVDMHYGMNEHIARALAAKTVEGTKLVTYIQEYSKELQTNERPLILL